MPRGVPKSGFRMTKKRMAKANVVAVAPQPVVESRFSINERFGFVSDMVMMLARGDQASVVVTGPGGLGKSFTVTKTLADAGFLDISDVDKIGRAHV